MWLVLQISMCSVVTLITAVVLCSCWKRKRQKDDWLGLDGMVTQKNPDENVNHLPSAALQTPQLNSVTVADATVIDECDYAKRPAIVSNTRRSLPDIPLEGQARGDAYEPSDNLSELYATVESYHNPAKRHTLPNGIDSRPSVSQHSSMSQADDAFSPYASVNYDKLNKLEHPYAIVKPHNNVENNEIMEEPTVRTSLLTNEGASNSAPSSDPNPPPRSRRSSAQSSLAVDINAATAVAGGIAASQELPYMTPPIGQSSQINFSGDSQDSSKGYTSISVREPLSNIIAQTKELNKTKRSLDPHYSTVSDDSDEMYTTIPDPNNQEYTSGSETYAQIQPVSLTVAAEVNPVPSSPLAITNSCPVDPVETIEATDSAPQPPSVDSLKNISHSRQASSSSSILNLGSPKPEKRQANSPLPPPPSATSPDFLNVDKLKNLDEMYAKVYKNKKRPVEEEKIDIAAPPNDENNQTENDKKITREHNYETLKKSPRKNSDPGYEKLKLKEECNEPGYARINGPDSLDPGYEIVNQNDPNYEQLNDRYNETLLGYSVINKLKTKEEPNYETMPDANYDQNDPNYESVKYLDVEITDSSNSSQLENTGYETLESSSSGEKPPEDPPYEKFNDSESGSAGYEKIKHGGSVANDYEIVKNKDGTSSEEGDDEIFQV